VVAGRDGKHHHTYCGNVTVTCNLAYGVVWQSHGHRIKSYWSQFFHIARNCNYGTGYFFI